MNLDPETAAGGFSDSRPNGDRPPTLALAFPNLHLGSFNGISADAFPTPPLSSRPSKRGTLPSPNFDQNITSPSRSRESSYPPPLPPPTSPLPPIPMLSPISPLSSLQSPSGSSFQGQDQTSSNSPRSLAPAITSPSRPVGAPLAMNIPQQSPYEEDSAVLKSAAGMARRRTLVDAKRDDRVTEVRLSRVMGAVEVGSGDGVTESRQAPSSPHHRLEKKASTNDLRVMPSSPSTRRTLPRPPISDPPSFDNPKAIQSTSSQFKSIPSTSSQLQPAPSLTPRMPSRSSAVEVPPANPQQQYSRPQQYQQQSRPMDAASYLPIVAGLADNGPYPSSRPASIKGQQGTLGRGVPRPPPQEEICLECMMRDRDLADVTVIGDDAWERASNETWEDRKRREIELLRSFGSDEAESLSVDGSPPPSPPASHSTEREGLEQPGSAEQREKAVKQAKRSEKDSRVIREIGWRGFKWEEGSSGEGLPSSFRGTKGGRLTEDGIRAVMTKFPSASAHRYNWLQGYLRHQYILTVEIATEAKRLGYFPAPVEIVASSTNSHEAYMPGLPATGSRTSSLTWDAQPPREPTQTPRNPYTSSPVPIPPSLVRPSPSSPVDLAMAGRAPRAIPMARPTTHFIPDREPSPASARQKLNVHTNSYNSNSLMPSPGLGSRDRWGGSPDPNDDAQWPPISPAESGMRPFSFAVRAGAVDRGSDSGHGRRSIFGRWGGSVTSFFGGSQGGSGSMMDMHLGLDSDRRNPASSTYVHAQPRAVSLASPTPPAFFGRDSRSSSYDNRIPISDRQGRSVSNSRLSQVLRSDENDYAPDASATPKKEKGLKGLLKKMKPKSRKSGNEVTRESSPASTSSPYRPAQTTNYPQQPRQNDPSQLQPPPSLRYLAGGGDRGNGQHSRNRSGSSSSMLTDSQDPRPNSTALPLPGSRSVSAPFPGSSSGGSANNSPTSSRFDKYGNPSGYGRPGSYASLSNRPGSGYEADLARESIVEVLSGQGQREMGHSRRESGDRYERERRSSGSGYQQQPNHRSQNKTNSSLSTSSVVEAPPPPPQSQTPSGNYFNQQQGRSGHTKVPSDQFSPNRFKNLPPLPPPGNDPYQQQQQQPSPYSQTRSQQPQQYMGQRDSYDPTPTRERVRGYDQPSPRLAQSMYAQPSGAASASSLASFARGLLPHRSPAMSSQGQGRRQTEYTQDAYSGMQQSQPEYGQKTFGYSSGQGPEQGGYGIDPRQQQGGWGREENDDAGKGGSQGKGTAGRKGIMGLFGKAGKT